jgi:uncharacterized membrane protein
MPKAMQTFKSDISQKNFPLYEKVTGQHIRQCIMDEIQKQHPDFTKNNVMAISELNHYRQLYIQGALEKEVGSLSLLEEKVLASMKADTLLAKDIENEESKEVLTTGQKLADQVASFGGSWRFIIMFGVFLVIWMLINVLVLANKAFDPYPFILLNLILSCIAALQAPVIMMSQNRQEQKDRQRARNDYMVNLKSELEIRLLHEKMDHLILDQQAKLMEVQQVQIEMMNDIMQQLKKH